MPLDESKAGMTEFLLVPYFGACIHTPPPPANQILHVRPKQGAKFRAMDTVWVTGKLQTLRNDSMMGVSGYHVTADSVTKYTGGASSQSAATGPSSGRRCWGLRHSRRTARSS